MKFRSFATRAALAAALPLAILATERDANAQEMGQKGQLAIDQISGFRMSTGGSLSYYGPLGFSVGKYSSKTPGPIQIENTLTATTFWLAPSADYFVIDHLSIGGLISYASTANSVRTTTGSTEVTTEAPTTSEFSFIPRVGYLVNFGERFGIWPRLGLGYIARSTYQLNGLVSVKDAYSGFFFELDAGFVIKIVDAVYFKLAPSLSFSPGGKHEVTLNNATTSADASLFQFALTSGIGVYFGL